MSVDETGIWVREQTVDIPQVQVPTLSLLGLPWDVDFIAIMVGEIEQGSGMAGIKDGLNDIA